MKKILVLGGTGAMGRYAVPELLRLGFSVDVVALDTMQINHENLTSAIANAMDDVWLFCPLSLIPLTRRTPRPTIISIPKMG